MELSGRSRHWYLLERSVAATTRCARRRACFEDVVGQARWGARQMRSGIKSAQCEYPYCEEAATVLVWVPRGVLWVGTLADPMRVCAEHGAQHMRCGAVGVECLMCEDSRLRRK